MSNLTDTLTNILTSTLESNNIGDMLTDFLHHQGVGNSESWTPAFDMVETSNNINLYISVPGVKADSIDIEFYNNSITITGDRVCPYDLSHNTTTVLKKHEIIYGKFTRKITIPLSVVNKQSVKTKLDNGMLSISIDKKVEEQNKFKVVIGDNVV